MEYQGASMEYQETLRTTKKLSWNTKTLLWNTKKLLWNSSLSPSSARHEASAATSPGSKRSGLSNYT